MLLVRWGTSDQGAGPAFQYGVIRQLLTEPGDDDEGIWPPGLTMHFQPDEQNAGMGSGHHRLQAPGGLAESASRIAAHPGNRLRHQPLRTELTCGPV